MSPERMNNVGLVLMWVGGFVFGFTVGVSLP